MNPLVTIAVITRNRSQSLVRTLASFQHLTYNHLEIIIVDNASTDDTADVIKHFGYRYIFSPLKDGFSKTRQRAIEAASGYLIAWCDDDCVPAPHWIESFVKAFDQEPLLALAGGKINNINFPPSLKYKGTEVMTLNAVLKPVDDPYKALYFANLNMAVRTSAVKHIGGYDPFFTGGYEEVDLNLSLRKAGFKIKYVPEAEADHYHNIISFKRGRWYYGGQLMRLYLYFKHNEAIGNRCFLCHEMKMMFVDFYRSIKGILSGFKRKDFRKISTGFIELFNAFSSRISMPVLYVKALRYQTSFLLRINKQA